MSGDTGWHSPGVDRGGADGRVLDDGATGDQELDGQEFDGHGLDDRDLVAVLTDDHRDLESLLARLEHLPPGHPSRRPLVDRVIMELVRHAAAEEQVLHPATRQLVPDGDDLVEHEHAEVEELMRRLESPEIPDEEYEATLDALIPLIRTHLREEERVLFPRLVEAASSQELRELGRLAGATIRRVPTRPHPSVPDEPPFDRLVTPDASLVERTRDLMTE